MMRHSAAMGSLLAACLMLGGLTACARPGQRAALSPAVGRGPAAAAGRPLPSPLYGVTVDGIADIGQTVAGLRRLPHTPTTRIYFDVTEPAGYYKPAVNALRPVSYLMGELLDSADEARISVRAFNARVASYLTAFGDEIDLWEIGNEVNGNWTGRYSTVRAKLVDAYRDVTAAGKRAALTLYDDAGCGDGPAELDPVAFSRAYVPPAVRDGLGYVLLSYYPGSCHGVLGDAARWTAYFRKLHALYPHALLGFGEVGLTRPATRATRSAAESLIRHYYGLAIRLPYYVGGYFWWYFKEDCLPYTSKPMWAVLRQGFQAEAAEGTVTGSRQPLPRHRPHDYCLRQPFVDTRVAGLTNV
jgi:hypothetical protein